MNFIFDVETTGLPKYTENRRQPKYEDLEAYSTARLLSISWIITHNGTPIEQSYYVIKPTDFTIGAESIAIHGITREHAMEVGVPMADVLKTIWDSMSRCRTLVAHNISFDTSIVSSEFYRAGMHDELAEMREKKQVCTMRKGKELMGIKKFPKLAELYKHLYNEDITNAHDAQYDTLYCYKCFDKMFPQEDDLFYFGDKEVRLTAEQKAVVYEATDKNMLVIACAGSGKSSTMLCRIKHLIDKGAPESSIIMMTFTRDAANDMRDKLHNIMGYKPDIKIGTIDSIAKYYTENHITSATAALKHVSEYGHYFLSYLQTCSPKFFERFQYLFVDEFQDINDTQYNIIQCFVKNGIRLFAVGDDAQNIYSFRGSSVEYILNFAGLFGNIAIHKLSRNFRCSEEIVNLANASIEKNVNQIPKVMTAAAAAGPCLRPRKKPRVSYFSYLKQQNHRVVQLIEQSIATGTAEHKIAVLSPTNQTLFMIEEALTKKGIANVLLDGKSDVRTRIKSGHVCLSTIHKSKGLEWDIVILVNMSDDNIPKIKNDTAEEESRRLFYVAVTRARHELYILYSASAYAPYVTRYIAEVDRTLYDFEAFNPQYISGRSSYDGSVIDKSVTKLVSLLDGADYVALKQQGIIPEIDSTKVKLFKASDYSSLIEREDIYADFGIFMDYVITRIVSAAFGLECKSKQALQTLACVTLDNDEYNVYKQYKTHFKLNVKSAAQNLQRALLLLERGTPQAIKPQHVETVLHILRRIRKNAQEFNLPVDAIPVFNYRFLPDGFDMTVNKSHRVYSNPSVPWSACINDIWEISKCNRVVGEYRRRLLFKDIHGMDFMEAQDMIKNIEESFIPFIKTQNNALPALHEEFAMENGMYGELDMRVGDMIIDFKTTISEDVNMEWVVQLLCYKALYECACADQTKINQIAFFNPLKGLFFQMNVSSWGKDKQTALVQYLLNKREKNMRN